MNPDVHPYVPPTANDLYQGRKTQPNVTSTNVTPNSTSGVENPSILQAHLTALSKLVESHAQSCLPLPKPDVFNGDPLNFPIWLKAFETLIKTQTVNPTEILHFLGRYVGGEAKEVMEGYMLMDGEDAHQSAKNMLSKRYGDPFTVASTFCKKLESWPQVAPQDALTLRRYADFLLQCEKAKERVDSLKFLNNDQEIHKLASRLPKWALTRWGRKLYTWRKEKKRSLSLLSLCNMSWSKKTLRVMVVVNMSWSKKQCVCDGENANKEKLVNSIWIWCQVKEGPPQNEGAFSKINRMEPTYGIYHIMGFTTRRNHIHCALYLIAVPVILASHLTRNCYKVATRRMI